MKRFFFIFLSLVMFQCTQHEHRLDPIDPPLDQLSQLKQQQRFITNCYILMLGRPPDRTETEEALSIFEGKGETAQVTLIDEISKNPDYYHFLVKQARSEYLEGVSEQKVTEKLMEFLFLMRPDNNLEVLPILQETVRGLEELNYAVEALQSNEMQLNDLHRIMVNNWFYDQINMGTANFVTSVFLHFLKRYPTKFEFEEASRMVEGTDATLFGVSGKHKDHFLEIFFNSAPYFEGYVNRQFERVLHRAASDRESYQYSKTYGQTKSMISLYKALLLKSDFAQ